MSHIAFYAPMKSPTHPIPSGDRAVARALLKIFGTDAAQVSSLRTYDGKGDIDVQTGLIRQAEVEAEQLIEKGRAEDWQLWFTYHNYYKAPDLTGPIVSSTLGIPYVLLEATRAKKRLEGPWGKFASLAENACDQADIILYFTQQDRQALEAYRVEGQQIIHLPPFLAETKTAPPREKPKKNTILSVGMMRTGAKANSYALIAQTLNALKTTDWHLDIIGDGPVRPEIEAMFTPFEERVTFLGQLDKSAIAEQYANAAVFLWPGVDEAFGMTYLEAQAAGLPIVAQNRPGLCDVIAPLTKLSAVGQAADMAHDVERYLYDAEYWQAHSHAGLEYIRQNHLLGTARKNLMTVLNPLIGSRP